MNLVTFTFYGSTLDVVTYKNRHYIGVKSICQAIGIQDFQRQQAKIKAEENIYEAKLLKVQTAGGVQEVFCIPLDKLNGWLFSINPNKTKPEVREKLILYKKECFRVLYEHFNKKEPKLLELEAKIKELEAQRDEYKKYTTFEKAYDQAIALADRYKKEADTYRRKLEQIIKVIQPQVSLL